MPFHVGPTELIIVLVIIMIIFGVGKLPQVGAALGKGLREFRKGQKDVDSADDSSSESASDLASSSDATKEESKTQS